LLLATFNVNSARARIAHLRRFLQRHTPDVVVLQELKCKTEEFPALDLLDLGYRTHAVGQPGGRNGVAVVARVPFEVIAEALPGEADDTHARYVEIAVVGLRLGGLYLPNGNSGGEEGYAYKLRWMARLADFRPHLSGAVWRGTATRLSDVHLDLYCDDSKAIVQGRGTWEASSGIANLVSRF
jgi:exodeoxyribonuclease-3